MSSQSEIVRPPIKDPGRFLQEAEIALDYPSWIDQNPVHDEFGVEVHYPHRSQRGESPSIKATYVSETTPTHDFYLKPAAEPTEA